jgi:hypothetical protein
MNEMTKLLTVKLDFPIDTLAQEKEEWTLLLRQDLLETDVADVRGAGAGPTPAGAKGTPGSLDTLLVTLAGSGSVLGTVISTIGNFLSQRKPVPESVTIKIDGDELTMTNPSTREKRQLVEAFVRRHSPAVK